MGMNNQNLYFHKRYLSALVLSLVLIMMLHANRMLAQNITMLQTSLSESMSSDKSRKFLGFDFNDYGFGDPAIKFSQFNNQFAFFAGGRGSTSINSRYTIGGGGYGINNTVIFPGSSSDTTRYFKMGFGGPEFGYIFFSKKNLILGSSLLIAVGAELSPGKPKSNSSTLYGNDLNFLTVMEPSIYGKLELDHFTKLLTGISYRFVNGSDLNCMNVKDISGFTCFLCLFFGK